MTEVQSREHGEPTLLTFQRDDSIFIAVKTISNASSHGPAVHYDLLSVLFIAEALDVDIFPITWNTMLGPLGRGATGKVEQAVINARTSFAFKRSIPARQQSDKDRYKAIISEIRTLRDPVLLSHPNIVELVGIGWDVNPEDATVWPVLLFRKAEFGTLKNFLSSYVAGDLSWDLKISLCRDVVAGLSCLHRENILHGDLKPENVVVVDVDGKPQGQLIDFAFSCWGATNEDLVWLPKTAPWAAPEHEWREFSFFEGKKMDVFSLGMVCSFVLFNECWNSVEEALRITEQTESSPQSSDAMTHHSPWKLGIIELLKEVLDDEPTKHGNPKDEVFSFLTLMLSSNPADRDRNLAEFSQILANSVHDELRDGEKDMAPGSHIFQWVAHGIPFLHKRLELFDRGHFMVREAILASLKARAYNETECPDCSFLAAAQVSFCYRIGFGTPRNVEDAETWRKDLQRRLSETEDLERMVQVFGQQLHNNWERTSNTPTSLQGLISDGFLHFNASDQLLSGIPMDQVIAKVKIEGESREAEFGEDHASTMYYTILLSVLYSRSGQPGLAEYKLRQACRILEMNEPEFSTGRHGVVQGLLVDLLRQRGDLSSAKSEVEKQLQLMQAACGPDHPDFLACLTVLARIFADLGDYTSAMVQQEKVLAGHARILGRYHRDTIGSITSLSSICRDSGDLNRAELLANDALERSEKVFGPDEHRLLTVKSHLATLMYDRGLEEEAGKEFRVIFEGCERQLGLTDERTLMMGTQLSSALIKLGQLEEAEELTQRLLLVSRSALGPSSQPTLALVNNLGSLKGLQGEEEQAQSLFLECVRLIEETQGPSSQGLITVLSNLAESHFRRGNHDIASSWQSRALTLARRYYKSPHPILAVILANGGSYSFRSEKYLESMQLNSEAASQFESIRGSDAPRIIECRRLIEKARNSMQELETPK